MRSAPTSARSRGSSVPGRLTGTGARARHHRRRQGQRLRPRRGRGRARARGRGARCSRAPTSRRASCSAQAGVRAPILVFGALSVSDLDGIFAYDLTPTISTPGAARALQAAAAKHGVAAALPSEDRHRHEPSRLPPRQPGADAARGRRSRRTWRSTPSTRTSRPRTTRSTRRSRSSASASSRRRRCCRRSGSRPGVRHAANSAALLRDERVWYDFVRPGLLLYGIVPPPLAATLPLRPALSLHSRIVAVKGMRPGEGTGYGLRIVVDRPRHDRGRPGRLRRRPRSPPGRPRLHARTRTARTGRRLGVHGHDDDRRDRHGCGTGRRSGDRRRAGRRIDRRARDRRVDRDDSVRAALPLGSRIQRVYE